jgi:hypothetical protein
VLTEPKDHLDFLAARLRGFTPHLIVLRGGASAKKRREALDELASVPKSAERLVLATGRYIGEGFDDARLDTLLRVEANPVGRTRLRWPAASVHSRYTAQRRSRASKCAQVHQPSDLSGETLFAPVHD